MRRPMLLALLALLLISCAGASDVTRTPEAIHARWIAAVRSNDRAAALDLVSADRPQRELFVDQTLHTMQDLMTAPSSPSGSLLRVDLQPAIDQGQGKRAISVWRFAKKTWCYATDLTASGAGWQVDDWGQTAVCP